MVDFDFQSRVPAFAAARMLIWLLLHTRRTHRRHPAGGFPIAAHTLAAEKAYMCAIHTEQEGSCSIHCYRSGVMSGGQSSVVPNTWLPF